MIQIGATPVIIERYICHFGNVRYGICHDNAMNHRSKVSVGILIVKQIIASHHLLVLQRFTKYSCELSCNAPPAKP